MGGATDSVNRVNHIQVVLKCTVRPSSYTVCLWRGIDFYAARQQLPCMVVGSMKKARIDRAYKHRSASCFTSSFYKRSACATVFQLSGTPDLHVGAPRCKLSAWFLPVEI